VNDTTKTLLLSAGLVGGMAVSSAAAQQPNVLVILADDLGYGDLSCYGAEKVKTPNIDRLARQGVRFTNAHAAAAVCQPSRYGVMTGRYEWRRGKPWDGTYMFEDKYPTLQQVLGKAGYDTAAFGKWHNGWGLGPVDYNDQEVKPGPLESGFKTYFGTPRSHNEPPQIFMENRTMYERNPSDPLRMISHNEVVERGRKDWGWGLSEGAKAAHEARPEDKIDLIVAKRAADFIVQNSKQGTGNSKLRTRNSELGTLNPSPFFLYVALVAPHVPVSPAKEFLGTSRAGEYGDYLQQLDTSVGVVLDALKSAGLDENTLVIFSSDNGAVYMDSAIAAGHHQNGNLLGQKTDAWCGANQVPFIARWPGKVPSGKTSGAFISLTDIMATVSAATGIEQPESAIDSLNQLPVFLNPDSAKPVRTEMIYTGIFGQGIYSDGWVYYPFQGSGGMTAHPTQRWGLPYSRMGVTNSDLNADGTLKVDAPPAQLYNVKSDPGQTLNLHNQHPERVATMKKRLAELIAPPATPVGDGSTLSISPAAPHKAPISWNGEVWGEPATVPATGNHYIHDNKEVWLLALGRNGSFPGKTITIKDNASIWLSGGGALGEGVLILNGGQIQNRSGSAVDVTGSIRVDSPSKILNISGSLELKTGLSGSGDLHLSAFQQSGSVTVGGEDQGYSGTFVLVDSAKDGTRLSVEFSTAFPKAGLRFQNTNRSRMPVFELKNDIAFRTVSLPAKNGGLISLPPGIYKAAALLAAGAAPESFKDGGGSLSVGQ
jgi:arylsulfatase A-like enzyme